MTKQLNIAAKLQWGGILHFPFYKPEALLLPIIYFRLFYFRLNPWLLCLGSVIWTT